MLELVRTIAPTNCALLAMLAAAAAWGAQAQDPSIEGRWTTYDDGGKTPRAIVAITAVDDHWTGQVVEVFQQPGEPADPRCDACSGANRGARVRGLKILELERKPGNLRLHGRILDPDEGISYRCIVTLDADARRLTIRAYIGNPVIGRDVVWERTVRPAQ